MGDESNKSVEELKKLIKLWMERCKKLEKENERLREKLNTFLGY